MTSRLQFLIYLLCESVELNLEGEEEGEGVEEGEEDARHGILSILPILCVLMGFECWAGPRSCRRAPQMARAGASPARPLNQGASDSHLRCI